MTIGRWNLRLKRKLAHSKYSQLIGVFIGILLSVLLSSILFITNNKNPFEVFVTMGVSVFGSWYGITETLLTSIPIISCAIAVGLAAMIKVWNIGAEGQFIFGAVGASIPAIFFSNLPPFLLLPLMFASGLILSGLLGFVPGVLKAWLDINEILVTLMLNYIASLFMLFLLYGPLKGVDNFPYSPTIPLATRLPILFNSRLHIGIFILLFLAIFLHLFLKRSVWGYELRVLGESYKAARYAGIGVRRNIIIIMVLSGMIAGLGGVLEIVGVQHRLQPSIAQGYGFTGIIVSWLAKNNMAYILLVSFFISGLFVSGNDMQISHGLPSSIILVFQGIVFLSILASDIFVDYSISLEKK